MARSLFSGFSIDISALYIIFSIFAGMIGTAIVFAQVDLHGGTNMLVIYSLTVTAQAFVLICMVLPRLSSTINMLTLGAYYMVIDFLFYFIFDVLYYLSMTVLLRLFRYFYLVLQCLVLVSIVIEYLLNLFYCL